MSFGQTRRPTAPLGLRPARVRALKLAALTLSGPLISVAACTEVSTNLDQGDGASGMTSGGAPTGGAPTAGAAMGGGAGALATGGASGAMTGGASGATAGGAGGASGASPGGAGATNGGAGGDAGGAGSGGAAMSGSGGAAMSGSSGAAMSGSGGASNAGAGAGGKAGGGAGAGGAGAGGKAGGGAGAGGAGAGGTAGGGGKGGASGAAGAGGSGGMAPTTGCGAQTWPAAGNKTITVGSAPRTFVMYVPTGYDTNRPYPVIFSWHGLTGSQGGFYSLNTAARAGASALMVSPQGLDDGMRGTGWWNMNGEDLALVDALIAWLGTNYCVDRNRLFSVGFSFGGMFSHLIGCERGTVFRAIAPIAGSFFSYYAGRTPMCADPVPMLGIHGTADESVTLQSGISARNVWVAENGCTMTTMPSTPTGCVDYQGCMGENAVKWCEHSGTHMVPSFAADAIWNFFRQF